MTTMRWRRALSVLALLALLLPPLAAHAGPGIVWLTAHSQGPGEEARIRIPLEWLVNADPEGHSEIRFDEETIDCTQLWLEHRDLPIGESREITRGLTDKGEEYIVQVIAEQPSSRRAHGKVHILTSDREGKSTDLRFPLDLVGLLQQLGSFVGSFFGADSAHPSAGLHKGFEADKLGDLKRLADYGPFVFLQSRGADGNKVKISIE